MIATPIIFIGAYLLFRERKPSLNILPNIDWSNKIPTIQFGNNKEALSNNTGISDAGITYSKKYLLNYKKDGNIMILQVKKRNGDVVETKTIDFKSKLIY